MATMRLASFEGEKVVFEMDYHNSNLRVQAVRCINNGTANARGTVLDGQTIIAQATFLVGTTVITVSQGKTLTIDQLGDKNWPYELRAEYPA